MKAALLLSSAYLGSSMMMRPVSDQQEHVSTNNVNHQVAPGTELKDAGFGYSCEYPYAYLPYEYATMNDESRKMVCGEITTGHVYRLEGGASVEKDANGVCTFHKNDTRRADQALCSKWEIQSYIIADGEKCPENTAFISQADISGYSKVDIVCKYLKTGDIVRTGYRSSIAKKEGWKNCVDIAYDTSDIQKRVCVNPFFKELFAKTESYEASCPEGKSLLTIDEVNVNFGTYCTYVPKPHVTRYHKLTMVSLAGSAVIVKDGNGDCSLYNYGWNPPGYGLCADLNRTADV